MSESRLKRIDHSVFQYFNTFSIVYIEMQGFVAHSDSNILYLGIGLMDFGKLGIVLI